MQLPFRLMVTPMCVSKSLQTWVLREDCDSDKKKKKNRGDIYCDIK